MLKSRFLMVILALTAVFYSYHCLPSSRFSSNGSNNWQSSPHDYYEGEVLYGESSYYANEFQGRRTANGEIFDMCKKTAAHRSFPFNTLLEVTNLENNQSVIVRVNDRGPFAGNRILDLSYAAAKEIGMISEGVVKVRIKILKWGT